MAEIAWTVLATWGAGLVLILLTDREARDRTWAVLVGPFMAGALAILIVLRWAKVGARLQAVSLSTLTAALETAGQVSGRRAVAVTLFHTRRRALLYVHHRRAKEAS